MFTRPDWKDASAYREIAKASLLHIAWEFLRRNPDYQKAWLKYAEQVRSLAAVDQDVARYAELILSANPTREMFDSSGDAATLDKLQLGLYEHGFLATVPGTPRTMRPLDRQHGAHWGLDAMPHPMQSYSKLAFKFLRTGTSITCPSSNSLRELELEDQRINGNTGLLKSRWLVLQIDLSLPAEVIESLVLRMIRDRRKHRSQQGYFELVKNRALSNAKYVEYLRILDGSNAAVEVSEIGEKIAPHENNTATDHHPRDKRFRAALIEATRIQTEGYRVLPLLQKTGTKSTKN